MGLNAAKQKHDGRQLLAGAMRYDAGHSLGSKASRGLRLALLKLDLNANNRVFSHFELSGPAGGERLLPKRHARRQHEGRRGGQAAEKQEDCRTRHMYELQSAGQPRSLDQCVEKDGNKHTLQTQANSAACRVDGTYGTGYGS